MAKYEITGTTLNKHYYILKYKQTINNQNAFHIYIIILLVANGWDLFGFKRQIKSN